MAEDTEGQRKSLETAVELDPESVDVWIDLGMVRLSVGKYQEAAELLKKCLEKQPEDFEDICGRFFAESFRSSHGEAFRKLIAPVFNKLDRQDNTPRELYNLACGFALAKDRDGMIWALKVTIEFKPAKYKKMAREDEDFREYWEDLEFIALTA